MSNINSFKLKDMDSLNSKPLDLIEFDLGRWSSELDIRIREGHSAQVAEEIQFLYDKNFKLTRNSLAPLGEICRRVGKYYIGLHWLRSIVHPKEPLHPEASQAEILSYAGLLAKIGAHRESLQLLDQIEKENSPECLFPEVFFHRCSVHFQRWEYAESLPSLKKFLNSPQLSEYQNAIGRVNSLAAKIALFSQGKKNQRVQSELKKIPVELQAALDDTENRDFKLLHANLLELKSQYLFFQNPLTVESLTNIQIFLQSSFSKLQNEKNLSSLFVQKWLLIADLAKNWLVQSAPSEISSTGSTQLTTLYPASHELMQFREACHSRNHYESLREIDLYLYLFKGHRLGVARVLLLTPSSGYRQKIHQEWTRFFKQDLGPAEFLFINKNYLSETDPRDLIPSAQILDLENLPDIQGTILQSLFLLLTHDSYRPLSEATLFSELYPEEYFNEESSPSRVSQAIHRLRQWMESKRLPIKIHVAERSYGLEWADSDSEKIENFWLRIPLEKPQEPGLKIDSHKEIALQCLKAQWPYQSFSPSAAAKHLKLSSSTLFRILKWAESHNKIYSAGIGRSKTYRFKK